MNYTCFSRILGKLVLCQISISLCLTQTAFADQTRSYKECIRLLESSQYDQSITLLQEMIASNPSKELWQCLGTVYFRKGDMRRAENAFKLGLTLDQNYWCLWGGLARVYYEQGRYDLSKEALAKANQLKENAAGTELIASASAAKSSPYKTLTPSADNSPIQASGKTDKKAQVQDSNPKQATDFSSSVPVSPESVQNLAPSPEPIWAKVPKKSSRKPVPTVESSSQKQELTASPTPGSALASLDSEPALTPTPTPTPIPTSTPDPAPSSISDSASPPVAAQSSISDSAPPHVAAPSSISDLAPIGAGIGVAYPMPTPEPIAEPNIPISTSEPNTPIPTSEPNTPIPTAEPNTPKSTAELNTPEQTIAPNTVLAENRPSELWVPAHSNAITSHLLQTGSLPVGPVASAPPAAAQKAATRRPVRPTHLATAAGLSQKPKSQAPLKTNQLEKQQKIASAPDSRKFPGKGEFTNWTKASKIFDRGSSCLKIGHYDYAAQKFQEAIKVYPYDPEFFHSLGLALKGQHKFEEAEKVCRNSVVLSKVDWDTWCDLGSILFDLKRYSESREAFKTAARLGPTSHGKEQIDWFLSEIGRRM